MSDDLDAMLAAARQRAHRARMRLVEAALATTRELADAGDLRGPVVVTEGTHTLARVVVDGAGRPVAAVVRFG